MSTITTLERYAPVSNPVHSPEPKENYLNNAYGWKSWLLTVDHKRIGLLYLVSVTGFFMIGMAAAGLIRYNLISPQGMLSAKDYNRIFTAHGLVMVFLFLVPVVPGVLGNFLIPIMIGARDLAFPKLNLLSWYLYMMGGTCITWALLAGGVDTGWTLYPPLSIRTETNVAPVALGIFIAGFSSILTALNIIVTVHRMRAPGMTWFRMPLFVWAMYATSLIILLATPVLAMTVTLLAVERLFQIGIYDPTLGGDPLLFQHMFWFYSHPAVYIMILPGMGIISEIITCFSRKNIFGYKAVVGSSVGIAVVGFFVWGHHMFVSGQGYYSALVFSLLSMLVAVPSAIKVFNWTSTLYRGSITFTAPMLYALGFIALFTIGGVTGMFLATLGTDRHLHDTYFVIAHFHFTMVGGMVMAYFAGLHFWWPKITGKLYSDFWGRMAALLMVVGFFMTFIPQFVLGYLGQPRRYHQYPSELQVLNVLSTAGSTVLGLGYLLPFSYLLHSLFWGKPAGDNPWGATGLEWRTSSPPPMHNFDKIPIVTEMPYEYALPTAPRPDPSPSDVVKEEHHVH